MVNLPVRMSLALGLSLAAFVAASPFYPIEHSTWLRINNGLVVATLAGAAVLGWRLRAGSWLRTAFSILGYTSMIAALFMAAYLVTTWFFSDGMKWIPLFHHDYVHHNPASVKAYLFDGDNYAELATLNLFCWLVFSTAYGAVGGLSAALSRYLGNNAGAPPTLIALAGSQ